MINLEKERKTTCQGLKPVTSMWDEPRGWQGEIEGDRQPLSTWQQANIYGIILIMCLALCGTFEKYFCKMSAQHFFEQVTIIISIL